MDDRFKKLLVTGGPGYIGSHTLIELLNKDYSIVTIDNLSNCYAEENELPESIKRIEAITGKKVEFYEVDTRDENTLRWLFEKYKFDCVIHFAAKKSVGESVTQPLEYYDNNVAGTNILLQVMNEYKVKKIVYSSSATVYGTPQFLPITEGHPTGVNIANPYGKTKYFCEEIIKDLCNADSEWKAIFLRYFNPIGAHESGMLGEDPTGIPNNLMPYVAQVAIGRLEKLSVYGKDYKTKDGTGVRDYLHVKDTASGHLNAVENINNISFKGWKAYNLGTGKGYSVLEMVNAFSKASGKTINYEIVERRPGDIPECYADTNLAAKELGWVAKLGLEDMCRDAWNWQNKNPGGYQTTCGANASITEVHDLSDESE